MNPALIISLISGVTAAAASVPEVQQWIAAHPSYSALIMGIAGMGGYITKSPLQKDQKEK